jgi:hypothetical protein
MGLDRGMIARLRRRFSQPSSWPGVDIQNEGGKGLGKEVRGFFLVVITRMRPWRGMDGVSF